MASLLEESTGKLQYIHVTLVLSTDQHAVAAISKPLHKQVYAQNNQCSTDDVTNIKNGKYL